MTARHTVTVPLALVAVQVFFAINYSVTKVLVTRMEPRAYALLRVAGAALVLCAAVRLTGRRLPTEPGVLWRLALYAFFGIALNQVLFAEGLMRTTPVHSSVVVTTIPVATVLFAVLFRQERAEARKLFSILVATAGVLLVMRPEISGALTSSVAGDVLTLCNGLSFALCLVLSRDLTRRTTPLGATAVLMGFGSLWIGVVGLGPLLRTDLGALAGSTWPLLAYVVLFPSAGAYLLQYWALARADSSTVAFFIYIQPILATILAILFLGERPGWTTLVGALLIFGGVYLALRRRHSKPVRSGSSAGPLESG